jgi:dTDP-4-dehydrorhamnose 3,5-epimerase
MQVRETAIPGVLQIQLQVFEDERGMFAETWRSDRYRNMGIQQEFVQDNVSRSEHGVLRGLHYQVESPQGHLVTVSRGKIFDVGVDLRSNSPTFGQWIGMELSDSRPSQVYLPPGVAHGFCVISDNAEILYKCTEFYRPDDEAGLLWCDPDLAIRWPIVDPIVTERDGRFPRLKDIPQSRLPRARI